MEVLTNQKWKQRGLSRVLPYTHLKIMGVENEWSGAGDSCLTWEIKHGGQTKTRVLTSKWDWAKLWLHLREVFHAVLSFSHTSERLVQPFLLSEMQSHFSFKGRKRSPAIFIAKYLAAYRQQSGWSSPVQHGFLYAFLYLVGSHSFGPLCKSSCSFVLLCVFFKSINM